MHLVTCTFPLHVHTCGTGCLEKADSWRTAWGISQFCSLPSSAKLSRLSEPETTFGTATQFTSEQPTLCISTQFLLFILNLICLSHGPTLMNCDSGESSGVWQNLVLIPRQGCSSKNGSRCCSYSKLWLYCTCPASAKEQGVTLMWKCFISEQATPLLLCRSQQRLTGILSHCSEPCASW